MKKVKFVIGGYYHVFNRGTDKRVVFDSPNDVFRFLESMEIFNNIDPIGSLREHERENGKNKNRRGPTPADDKLVEITVYCLNPNHFHLILKEITEGGISEFMKRLSGGYTSYYNIKYKRSGVLFQGKFKAVYIESNEQLLYVVDYVNLNNKVHKKFDGTKKHFMDSILSRSSWDEYANKNTKLNFCEKDIILDQYEDKKDYKESAQKTVEGIKEMRYGD